MSYDPLYIKYFYYFNVERDYFECHEVMEELWLEEGRSPLLQGLLQVAVSLYHYRNGNGSGAVKLMEGALDKLEGRKDAPVGFDLPRLLDECRAYLAKLHRANEEPFAFYDLTLDITDEALAAGVEALKKDPPKKHDEE